MTTNRTAGKISTQKSTSESIRATGVDSIITNDSNISVDSSTEINNERMNNIEIMSGNNSVVTPSQVRMLLDMLQVWKSLATHRLMHSMRPLCISTNNLATNIPSTNIASTTPSIQTDEVIESRISPLINKKHISNKIVVQVDEDADMSQTDSKRVLNNDCYSTARKAYR